MTAAEVTQLVILLGALLGAGGAYLKLLSRLDHHANGKDGAPPAVAHDNPGGHSHQDIHDHLAESERRMLEAIAHNHEVAGNVYTTLVEMKAIMLERLPKHGGGS